MKIVLIGYRASGKSTIGMLLSKRFEIPFVDTDALVETTTGLSIKELIAQEGWEKFRARETQAVASLAGEDLGVVATGGGAILAEQNRVLLKKMGTLVCLKAPLSDIVERLERDRQNAGIRPPLTSQSLVAETVAVMKERAPIYETLADFTVDTQDKSVVRVTDEIYQYLLEAGIVFEIKKLKKKMKTNS